MAATIPESRARRQIDAILQAYGWVAQSREVNLQAAPGATARKVPTPTGAADDIPFLGGRACGARHSV